MEQRNDAGARLIDPTLALGFELPDVTTSHDERDISLYALGVGACADASRSWELPLVYEGRKEGIAVLPTFGVVPAVNALMDHIKHGKQAPGLTYGLDRTLHGEQRIDILAPMPKRGRLTHKSRIKDLVDKGKNALVVTEIRSFDIDGVEVVRNEVVTFVRGAGGFGGERVARGVQTENVVIPDRAADVVTTERIAPNQALMYRLSGDWNPLHADPVFAKEFGLPMPILHGLCTFGFAGRQLVHAFCDDDVSRLRSLRVRFSDSVFPGETLKTEMWQSAPTAAGQEIVFRCSVVEREKVVLSNAVAEIAVTR